MGKRKLIRFFIVILLFACGAAALKANYLSGVLVTHNQSQLKATKLGANKISDNIQNAENKNKQTSPEEWAKQQGSVKNVGAKDFLKAQRDQQKDPKKMAQLQGEVIGSIAMPAIQTYLPILNNATDEHLLIGAGTAKQNEVMGGNNNYVLAAHNIEVPHVMFSSINEMNEGNLIYVTDLKNVYTYKVNKKYIVNPDTVDIQDNQGQNRMITLYTCFAQGRQRTVVQGELIAKQSYQDAPSNVTNLFNLDSKAQLQW